jgi:hypothetical protein
MTVSPEGDVCVPPGGSIDIATQFAPADAWATPCATPGGVADVLIFLNDEDDHNEAVFRLRVRQR